MITRRSRNLLSLAAGALVLASIPFPTAFAYSYWGSGTNGVGFEAIRLWCLFLGALIVGAGLLELMGRISTRLILIAAGAVGLWEFVGAYLRLRVINRGLIDATTFSVGPGLVMAALGAAIALVAGALALWSPCADLGGRRRRERGRVLRSRIKFSAFQRRY
jgi:hypothetical protein